MSGSPSANSPSPAGKPAKQRRTWKQRLIRIGIIIVALAILLRLALAVLLPVAITRAAGFYGLSCDYSHARLGMLSGYATLWDVSVAPKEGGKPVLTAQFCDASISVPNLLRGKLVVWRVEADGVWVDLQRQADGSIPLLQRFASPPAKNPAPSPAPAGKQPPRELELGAPFQMDAFRLTHLRAHILDHSVRPAFEGTVNADVRVSQLGQADRPALVEVGLWSEQLLDQLRLVGEASSLGRNVKAQFRVQARGINPTGASVYLQALGIRPLSNDVNMTANLTLETSAVEGTLQAIKGTAVLRDIRVFTESASALRIGSITLNPRYIGPDRIDAGTVTISDISATAQRLPEGLAFAGLVYSGPPAPPPAPTTAPVAASRPASAPSTGAETTAATQPFALPAVSLDELVIRNVRLVFADEAVQPAAKLGLTLKTLRLANLATYAGAERRPVELNAELSAEGIAEAITIDGKADPFAEAKTGNFRLHVGGIRLEAIRPYLEAAGLESTLVNGALNCEVSAAFKTAADGRLEGEIKASDVSLADRAPLLQLSDARLSGCEVDPKTLEVRIGAIDIAGPTLSGVRNGEGQIEILGLRTKPGAPPAPPAPPSTSATSPASAPAPAPPAPVVLPIPRFRIDRFTWKDIRLDLQDNFVKPATTLAITDAGVELTDLALELAEPARPAQEARLRAWMKFPGVVDDLELSGTVAPTLRSARLAIDTRIEGITGELVAPYLAAAGITPALQKGRFQMHTESYAELTPTGMAAELLLKDLKLEDSGKPLAGVEAVQVQGFRTEAPLMAVRTVKVSHPQLTVERGADGTIAVMGVRMGNTPAPAGAGTTRPSESSPRIPELPRVTAEQVMVEGAQISWTDRQFEPAVQIRGDADMDVLGVHLGEKAGAARAKLRASVPGNVEQINAEGLLTTSPGELGADWSVLATGIKGGAIEAYLPPTLAVGMRNGQASLRALAHAANNPEGGVSAELELRNLDVREMAAATPLLAVGSIRLAAPRIDPAAQVVALDEVSVKGVLAAAERTLEGDVMAAGIRSLAQKARGRPAPVARKDSGVGAGQGQGEQEVATILTAARRPMPEVSVERLLVDVDEIRFRDAMRPSAAPLTIGKLQLWNLDRLVWLGKDPTNQPANRLELVMRVDPLIDRLQINAEVAPFAEQASARVHVAAEGIRGEGLNALVPELAGKLDGSTLNDGRFQADLEAAARIERHGPMLLELQHGFQADLAIRDVTLRNGSAQRILGGVQEIRATGVKVNPAGHLVQAPSIEITKPIAYLERDSAGLRAMGLRVLLPGEAQPATSTASPAAPAAQPAHPARPALAAPPAPTTAGDTTAPSTGMGLQVRRLTVSGIDVVFEDKVVQPPLIVPLTQLDVEVQDLDTTARGQGRPMRFSAVLGSGKVELPKHGRGRQGAGGDTGREQRDLFSLITANGAVTMSPQMNGWAKGSLNGMELIALSGVAKQYKLDLKDGVLDCDVNMRIRSQQDADVRARAVVTDLSVSEEPGGPVSQTMKLSVPLDAALGLLEDPDGSITLPVKFSITGGKISYASLVASATAAAAQTVATAVASSPVKLVQGVGGLLGGKANGDKKERKEPPTAMISFAPGTATIEPAELRKLQAIVEQARRDRSTQLVLRHELSEADQVLAEARANPSPEDAMDMIRALRARKQELQAQQQAQAVTARTRLASVPELLMYDDLRDLRATEQQLDSVDTALDQLLDLQRPGADRQAGRRTRAMALAIGQARLDAVQQAIAETSRARAVRESQETLTAQAAEAARAAMAQRTTATPASAQVVDELPAGRVVVTLVSRKR